MRLCVIADSHLCRDKVRAAVQAEKDCDAFIHLGDLALDSDYMKELTDKPVPHEAHDIPVDGVLTPDGFTEVRR